MLGDNPERSKNPLIKAIRRRNTKTVQFSAPTYVEASDVEYSSEEEEEGEGEYFGQGPQDEAVDGQDQERDSSIEGNTIIEPLQSSGQPAIDPQAAIDPRVDAPAQTNVAEKDQPSEDAVETNGMCMGLIALVEILTIADENALAKSRKGTLRNTDSFFKDDNVETRKINLTPSLLRDDSSSTLTTIRSIEPKEVFLHTTVISVGVG